MINFKILTAAVAVFFLGMTELSAQCGTFADSPRGEDGLDANSVYSQALKQKEWDLAYNQWKIAYEIAPAADGKRHSHYTDGAKILIHRIKNVLKDPEEIKAAKAKVMELYDQAANCYQQKVISVRGCKADDQACYDKQAGKMYGRKAYDMYYHLVSPYDQLLEACKNSIRLAGDDSEYVVFQPYVAVLVKFFQDGKMSAEDARAAHIRLNEIADYNIAKGNKLSPYYQQAKDAMNAAISPIETDIYDCEYFLNKYKIEYEAEPDSMNKIKYMIATLKKQDCPEDNEFLMMLEDKWGKYAEAENARILAELESKKPQLAAKRLYNEGRYEEAIAKYRMALDSAETDEERASYWFSISSIQFRKLNQYGTARVSARNAAKYNPDWGRPWMIIGDMYATTARNCGDSWNQRLAILAAMEKYRYARGLDSEVAEEANEKLGRYQDSMPSQEEGFMRQVKEGSKANCGCWIGETVTIRYKS